MSKTADHSDDLPINGRLDAVILLAGGLRPSPLVQGTGISVLDLPLQQNQTVLENWIEKLSLLRDATQQTIDQAVVAYTANSPRPSLPISPGSLPTFRFVCDQTGLRGPAGTVRDLCQHLPPDANIFLGEASRFVNGDLRYLLRAHLETAADITLGQNPDGEPAGIYLTKRKTLDLVPAEGFIDLKEQWLPRAVGAGCIIRVVTGDKTPCQPLRTWKQFMQAIRASNQPEADQRLPLRFFSPSDHPLSNVVIKKQGANVAKHAQIMNSVLMPGSIVDEGAVIARSYIGPGVHITAGEKVVDRMIQSNNGAASPTNETRTGLRSIIGKKKRNRK